MSKRKDPFRTLDDPEPAPRPDPAEPGKDPLRTLDDPAPAEPAELGGGPLVFGASAAELRTPEWLILGHLRVPLRRPGWFRRLIVWLLLGWRWDV